MQGTVNITRSNMRTYTIYCISYHSSMQMIKVLHPSLHIFVGNVSSHEANMTEPSQKESVTQNTTEDLSPV